MTFNIIIDKSDLIKEIVRRDGRTFDKVYVEVLSTFPDEFQRVNTSNLCGSLERLSLASMYQIVRFQFPKQMVYSAIRHFKLKYGHFNVSMTGLPHTGTSGLIVSKFGRIAYETIEPQEYLFMIDNEPDYECFCDPIYELSPYLTTLSKDPAKAYEMSLSICPSHSTELIKKVFRSRDVRQLDRNTAYAMLIYDFDRDLSDDIIRIHLSKFKLSDMPSIYTIALFRYYTHERRANEQLKHGKTDNIDILSESAIRDALKTQYAVKVLCMIPNKVMNFIDMLNVTMIIGLARKRRLKSLVYDRIIRHFVENNMFVEFEVIMSLHHPISQTTLNAIVTTNGMKFARALIGKFNDETLDIAASLNLTDMYMFICNNHDVRPKVDHLEKALMLNNTQLSIYIERKLF